MAPHMLLAAIALTAALGDERIAQVERLAAEYAALGFPIDAERLSVRDGGHDEARRFFGEQQSRLFSEPYFSVVHVLLLGFRVEAPEGSEALRGLAADAFVSALIAYYRPGDGHLVFLDHALSPLASLEHLLAHELAHAWQDQAGIFDRLLGNPTTTERARVVECLLEGGAEVLALGLALSRQGADLGAITPGALDSPLTALAGPMAQPYVAGRDFMLARWRAGGWDAVRAAYAQPPTSSEQLLHPDKLERDLPRDVELPAWPEAELGAAARGHADVLGEAMIRRLLMSTGIGEEPVWIGASGWDGDRIDYHETDAGWVARWRSVWDRDEDAAAFERLLSQKSAGQSEVRGRVVDWVFAPRGITERKVLAHLAAHPIDLAFDEADAKGTAEQESVWLAEHSDAPRIAGDRWVHPEVGLSLPVPEGWKPHEVNGFHMLAAEPEDGFADNVNVTTAVLPEGIGLGEYVEASVQQFESLALEVLSALQVELAGRAAARIEYTGEFQPGQPVHGVCVGFIEAGRQITVAISIRRERWEQRKELVEALLAGLAFEE